MIALIRLLEACDASDMLSITFGLSYNTKEIYVSSKKTAKDPKLTPPSPAQPFIFHQ